ncbi:MAG: RdgB/HAM1 family non-canonical purine NTP pyrophosphatase [Myxococcota bacterium]
MSVVWMATGNAHKLREVREMLAPLGFEVMGCGDVEGYEVVEDGETFEANALKKANTLSSLVGAPAIADDSGIEVDALDGRPGVYSARYAGVEGPGQDQANLEKLVVELRDVPEEQRGARYVCALAYVIPNHSPRVFHGTLEGRIIDTPRGEGGFGYDPIFLLPDRGLTAAQISAEEKHAISHRGKAVRAFVESLKS